MSKPPRQRPGATSDVSRRLQPNVEGLMPTTTPPLPEHAPAGSPTPATEPAENPPANPAWQDVKESFSTRIPRSTLAAAKAAVMATAGQPGGCRSLADLITQAVNSKVGELQQEFNDGRPFPNPETFRTGRPLGT